MSGWIFRFAEESTNLIQTNLFIIENALIDCLGIKDEDITRVKENWIGFWIDQILTEQSDKRFIKE